MALIHLPFDGELGREILKDAGGDFTDAAAPINNRHGGYIALDNKVIGETKQCPHCQGHWVYRKGSGRVRHFCPKCMQSTCGRPQCHPDFCMPWEKQMEAIERADRKRREVESWLNP